VLAKPLDECWHKKDRSFYAQITYFICIKWSSLHSLNSPNSPNLPNLPNSCKTCLLRVWRVLAKWFGKCQRVWRVFANELANIGESGESSQNCLANVAESGIFLKRAILANVSTRQKSASHSQNLNSLNLCASSHCLVWTNVILICNNFKQWHQGPQYCECEFSEFSDFKTKL
jgi:hypothetical protein